MSKYENTTIQCNIPLFRPAGVYLYTRVYIIIIIIIIAIMIKSHSHAMPIKVRYTIHKIQP